MTCASGVRCFTRNTPGLEFSAERNSAKCFGMVRKIVSDENATLRGGDRQHLRVTHTMQFRGMCREEVNRRFASCAAGDDRVTEAGVRQEADHALPRRQADVARAPAFLSDQREPDASR